MKPSNQTLLEQWYGADKAKRMRAGRKLGDRSKAFVAQQVSGAGDVRGYAAYGATTAAQATVTPEGRPVPNPEEKAQLRAAMDGAISAINSAASRAMILATATPTLGVVSVLATIVPALAPLLLNVSAPSEVRQAVISGINAIQNLIDKTLPPARDKVLNGDLTPDQFFAKVKAAQAGLDSVLQELNDSGTVMLLNDALEGAQRTADEIWGNVKKAAGDVATAFKWGSLIYLALGGVVLYFAWPIVKNILTAYATAPLRAANVGALPSGKRRRR